MKGIFAHNIMLAVYERVERCKTKQCTITDAFVTSIWGNKHQLAKDLDMLIESKSTTCINCLNILFITFCPALDDRKLIFSGTVCLEYRNIIVQRSPAVIEYLFEVNERLLDKYAVNLALCAKCTLAIVEPALHSDRLRELNQKILVILGSSLKIYSDQVVPWVSIYFCSIYDSTA